MTVYVEKSQAIYKKENKNNKNTARTSEVSKIKNTKINHSEINISLSKYIHHQCAENYEVLMKEIEDK